MTLYGEDPDDWPTFTEKSGESGVSVCTQENMHQLFAGFDLCHPSTSVSMTINGPAPIILAMFLNTAVDQAAHRFAAKKTERNRRRTKRAAIDAYALKTVRGTVQADILKEDQGQNTCIFSIEFALRLMGDVKQYFIDHDVHNFYSVRSAGITSPKRAPTRHQLAFTLANGFTYVEYFCQPRHGHRSICAKSVLFLQQWPRSRVHRHRPSSAPIWAKVIKRKYGGKRAESEFKYHIQTCGRSLHAQEMSFNDIRTTLQALLAIYDNCNSLHTNAYDEAITTPTEASVRRAMAIQLIITKEFGLAKNENPLQGSSSSKS